ncbi:MAG: hypothetical protein J5715_00900 [Clostridiales bacterium]|nr:hypothetical protein [Clostridiales bacterium]
MDDKKEVKVASPAKKACAKKACAKKPAAKKTTAKNPAAKKVAKKTVAPKKFVIQAAGSEVSYDAVVKKVNKAYKENIKTLEIYVKPEENKAYYFINGKDDGSVDLF